MSWVLLVRSSTAIPWPAAKRRWSSTESASELGFPRTYQTPTMNLAAYGLVFGLNMSSSVERYPYFLFRKARLTSQMSNSPVSWRTSLNTRIPRQYVSPIGVR